MRNFACITAILSVLVCCTNKGNEKTIKADNRVSLRADTVNLVKLTDTLVIFESTCRGCAVEVSTNFGIQDSLGIIKLENVITADNNPPEMNGGSVSKELILVPVKPGRTTFKLYKFWTLEKSAEDSARFTSYIIDVRN